MYRVTTHLENLEKSGNSKLVRVKAGETEISFMAQLNYQYYKYKIS